MKKIFLVLFCVLTYFNITQAQTIWYDPMNADHPQVMGRGWNDEIGKTYHRLPERQWLSRKKVGGYFFLLNIFPSFALWKKIIYIS